MTEIQKLEAQLRKLRMHDYINRIIFGHCVKLGTKYEFECSKVHSGKIKLKALKNRVMQHYWYIDKVEGVYNIAHGASYQNLKDFFKIYNKQFNKT